MTFSSSVLPKVGPKRSLEKISEYLSEVDRLRKLGHVHGESQREDLNYKIKALINNAFDNPQDKIKDYDSYVNVFFAVVGEEKSSQEEENDYQQNLREMETMLRSYYEELEMVDQNNIAPEKISYDSKHIFVVYGHDTVSKLELARMIDSEFNLKAVLLDEQADMGRTIIEKFEGVAKIPGYAFVLFTPDDLGGESGKGLDLDDPNTAEMKLKDLKLNMKYRARQNVVLELGYFFARQGRNRVCCLYKTGVELPSDISGVIYKEFTRSVSEKEGEIRRELRAVGYDV